MPEKTLTLDEKVVKMLKLMDTMCYRLDALEMWQKNHEEHVSKVRKEQIKNTKDFIEDMKHVRSGVIKALSGEASNMEEIVNDQMMFDQRTIDKLKTMIERAELEQQQPKNIKEKNELEELKGD